MKVYANYVDVQKIVNYIHSYTRNSPLTSHILHVSHLPELIYATDVRSVAG